MPVVRLGRRPPCATIVAANSSSSWRSGPASTDSVSAMWGAAALLVMRWAITLRMALSGSRLTPFSFSTGVVCLTGGLSAARSCSAATTSLTTTAPSGPLPLISVNVSPSAAASRRALGELRGRLLLDRLCVAR